MKRAIWWRNWDSAWLWRQETYILSGTQVGLRLTRTQQTNSLRLADDSKLLCSRRSRMSSSFSLRPDWSAEPGLWWTSFSGWRMQVRMILPSCTSVSVECLDSPLRPILNTFDTSKWNRLVQVPLCKRLQPFSPRTSQIHAADPGGRTFPETRSKRLDNLMATQFPSSIALRLGSSSDNRLAARSKSQTKESLGQGKPG